jgi:hypothetical protein
MSINPRTWGFLVVAIVMVLLLEPTPEKYRWVNVALAALATFWFVVFLIEDVLRARREKRPSRGGFR